MAERSDGIGVGTAMLAGAGAVLLSALGLVGWRNVGGDYPQLPWLAVIPMLLYAVLVLYAAWRIRQYVRSDKGQPVAMFVPTPQQARGTLVAAQAGALGGALLVGFYLANAAVHIANIDVPSVRGLFARALVCAGAALLVSVAGFVGQWMCRLPPQDGEGPGGTDGVDVDGDGVAFG
ncbi:hypothetical protein BH23ACT6_BH23ACT6_05560 [soil metagenome]